MEAQRRCPRCNAVRAPDAPEGLCPACLLGAGLAAAGAGSAAETAAHLSAGFVPPAVQDMARLFPQLEIVEFLGRGGMSAVYKARQPNLGRVVAIKVLPANLAAVPGFAERFVREAQALARLNHPNIVAVHDFGRSGDLFYFVMEYVDGPNLRRRIQDGTLTPAEVLAIIPRICEALQYAHDEGVVHRDIKPENILTTSRGQVKIADFGIAKLLQVDRPQPALTESGQVMGTPHYMAPEQVEHPRQVDHRADIYSLGVVFYELLTGELPLGKFSPPSAKVHVDLRLDEVVLKALEKEPERRYQRASEMKSRVETAATWPAAAAGAYAAAPFAVPLQDGGSGSAARAAGAEARRVPAGELPRLCKLPLWGAAWAVFGLAAAVMFFTVRQVEIHAGTPPEPPASASILKILAMAAGIIGLAAPVGATVLGFLGIAKIRASSGRLYGMILAVFVALLYPILIGDAILYAVFDAVRRNTDLWNILLLVWVLVILALDWLAIRAVWRASTHTAGGRYPE
ncbi:MAG TPA: hypothetical protein DCM87_21460 [Planctomycetes bacterium]|nr:hypothetical protein [Planctomycetota bacterium]